MKLLPFLALLSFLASCVPCPAQNNNAPAAGGTLGPAYRFANYSNSFPNFTKRVAAGLPLRIMFIGDSVSSSTGLEFSDALAKYYGRSGGHLQGGNNYGYNVGPANTVTNISSDTNWWTTYFDVSGSGTVTTTNFYNPLPNGNIWANRADVYYIGFTNAGGFNVLISSNGGAYYLTSSIPTASAVLTGKVASIALIPGRYQIRVSGSNSTAKLVGMALWDTNSPGVRTGGSIQSGGQFSNLADVSNSVVVPIVQAIAPDILFLESTADAAGTVGTSLTTWETIMGQSLTNTDVVYLGTPPIAPAYAFDYVSQNRLMASVAQRYRRIYFDQSIISGTFSNMLALGLAGDQIHRTNLLDKQFAGALIRAMGIGDSAEAGLAGFGHANTFSTTQIVNAPFIVKGSASGIYLADQADAWDGVYGRQTLNNGQYKFGMLTTSASFDSFMIDGSWGAPTPTAIGGAWGRAGLPFTVHGTNNVEYGMGQFNKGSYYPTNVAASLPNAATLGVGGYWVGNSNGVLVSLYSINGTTTQMKVLVP